MQRDVAPPRARAGRVAKNNIPVAPTAGYYGDGARFLNDIDAKRRELGIADAELIRAR